MFAFDCVPPDLDYPERLPARYLLDAGFEVHIVARRDIGRVPSHPRLRCHVEGSALSQVIRIVRLRPELVFCESPTREVVFGSLGRRTWIRNPLPARRRWAFALQQWGVRQFDAVTFTNPALEGEWGVAPDRICELPYPVDVTYWSNPDVEPTAWGWGQRSEPREVITYVANFTAGKRQLELIGDLAPLLRSRPGLVLALAGYAAEDGLDRALDEMARRHDVAAQVVRTGWLDRPNLRALLARTDLSVIASRAETQCMALYEALAAGVPVVVSDIPALVSQFPMLPSYASGEELRTIVGRLLDSPEARADLVRSARDRVAAADLARHDDLFHATVEALLGRGIRWKQDHRSEMGSAPE